MTPSFKMDPKETATAPWHEVYVSFDKGLSWYAIGGGSSPLSAQGVIEWYRAKFT